MSFYLFKNYQFSFLKDTNIKGLAFSPFLLMFYAR